MKPPRSPLMNPPSIAEVAGKLTEAQRRAVAQMPDVEVWGRDYLRCPIGIDHVFMSTEGLVYRSWPMTGPTYRLTPLGQQVRAHLEESK